MRASFCIVYSLPACLSLTGTAPASYYQSSASAGQLSGLPLLTASQSGSVLRSSIRDGLSTSAGYGASRGQRPSLAFNRSHTIHLPPPIPSTSSSRPGSSSGGAGAGSSAFFARRPGTAGGGSIGVQHRLGSSGGGLGSLAPGFGLGQQQQQQHQFGAAQQHAPISISLSSESPFSFHAPEPDAGAAGSGSAGAHQQQSAYESGEPRRGVKRARADSDSGYGGADERPAPRAGDDEYDRDSSVERGDGHFELSRERERGSSPRPQSRRLAVMELCDVGSCLFGSCLSFCPDALCGLL